MLAMSSNVTEKLFKIIFPTGLLIQFKNFGGFEFYVSLEMRGGILKFLGKYIFVYL